MINVNSIPSKINLAYYAFFFAFAILHIPSLEAGGWGKTNNTSQYEDAVWNEVYFDMNGLYFTATIPNYSGACLQNGEVGLDGKVKNAPYTINTTFNAGFNPPKTMDAFLKMISDANPTFIVVPVDSRALGSKYAVDIIPKNQNEMIYWRFLSTKDRLIKMGTTDANSNRRLAFFESIVIH